MTNFKISAEQRDELLKVLRGAISAINGREHTGFIYKEISHLQSLPPEPAPVAGEVADYSDLLFRLDYWGNFTYEEGCKYAHEILLEYRREIVSAIESAAQKPAVDHAEALLKALNGVLYCIRYYKNKRECFADSQSGLTASWSVDEAIKISEQAVAEYEAARKGEKNGL